MALLGQYTRKDFQGSIWADLQGKWKAARMTGEIMGMVADCFKQ